jgi:small subunit ribosomal protein S3
MGQKVHPYVLRLGFGKDWLSRWISLKKREYAQFLEEDIRTREVIKKNYPLGSIANILIERVSATIIRIRIRTSRPGVIIGRRGQDIERVKKELVDLTKKEVIVDVEEVSEPAMQAQLAAELIAFQMTKRVGYRRAMKKAMQQAQNLGCEGMRLKCSGRLDGAEIARAEIYKYGKVPLQTFRADIDYGQATAKTTYGTNGVKVWIYKGEKKLGSYLIREQEDNSQTQE